MIDRKPIILLSPLRIERTSRLYAIKTHYLAERSLRESAHGIRSIYVGVTRNRLTRLYTINNTQTYIRGKYLVLSHLCIRTRTVSPRRFRLRGQEITIDGTLVGRHHVLLLFPGVIAALHEATVGGRRKGGRRAMDEIRTRPVYEARDRIHVEIREHHS